MNVVTVDIPSNAVRLSGIVDIANWLRNQNVLPLEQFAVDWIEKYVDRADEILESDEIENTDDEFRGATHYEVQTILQVIRPNTACYLLFADLETLTRSKS